MGSQHESVVEVEGVGVVPRRMIRGDVERLEVVKVVFDLRAVLDGEAHLPEDRLQLEPRPGDRVQRAAPAAAGRQGHIDPLPFELDRVGGRRRRRGGLLDALLDALLQLVDRLAGLLALLGGQLAELLHQRRDFPLASEEAQAQLFDRIGVAGIRDRLGEFAFDPIEGLAHGLCRRPRRLPRSAPG